MMATPEVFFMTLAKVTFYPPFLLHCKKKLIPYCTTLYVQCGTYSTRTRSLEGHISFPKSQCVSSIKLEDVTGKKKISFFFSVLLLSISRLHVWVS